MLNASFFRRRFVSALLPLCLLLGVALKAGPIAAAEKVEATGITVLTSVRPLALIAQAVVTGHDRVDVLVSAGQSPHHYSLKVSDRQRIEAADLVFWVGPELERFLEKPLRSAKQSLRLVNKEVLHNDHGHEHDHGHSHSAESHPWLAPDAAADMARLLAERLAALSPDGAQTYRANAEAFAAELAILDTEIRDRFANRVGTYAVAHDAYRSFSEHYGLPEPIVLSVSPEVSPGARKLWELRSSLRAGSCVLVELEHQSRWVNALVESQQLTLLMVDTLAYSQDVNSYQAFLEAMARTFDACLAG